MKIVPKYVPHPDETFNGNPLTECIQPILDAGHIGNLLLHEPEFSRNFHELPMLYKNTNIRRISELFVPPEMSVFLYYKLMELILDGYKYRNPFSVKVTRFLEELASRGQLLSHEKLGDEAPIYQIIPPGMTTAPATLVWGPSGTGKTSIVRAILGLIPQAFSHNAYGDRRDFRQDQLVWVSFDAPSTPSPKQLVLNFMKSVDDAIGTSYYEKWSMLNTTRYEVYLAEAQNIAANHYIGLAHIDELQFMTQYAKSANAPSFQMIEAMFNKIGIPLLMSCTREGLILAEQNYQTQRRFVNERVFEVKPLEYGSTGFVKFISKLFSPNIWGETNVFENQLEFLKRFHYLSVGLQAVMIRLARLHIEYCCQIGKDPFDLALLEAVFDKQFHFMKESLNALRAGHTSNYEKRLPRDSHGRPAWTAKESSGIADAGIPPDELTNVLPLVGRKSGTKQSDVKRLET